MNYPTLLANVVAMQAAIDGVREAFDHEPGAVNSTPAFYNRLDDFTVVQHSQGGKRRITYRVRMRLCVRYNNNQEAEATLAGLLAPTLDAFDTNKTLTVASVRGALTSDVPSGDAGYVSINGVVYRYCDFTLAATTEETVAYA